METQRLLTYVPSYVAYEIYLTFLPFVFCQVKNPSIGEAETEDITGSGAD